MLWRSSGCEYQSLPQSDWSCDSHVSVGGAVQSPYLRGGNSFDFVPKITDGDFTDRSQGWLSWMCQLVVSLLVYVFVFFIFPLSAWFVLKVVPNYQRIVMFRLGRSRPPKGPGVVLILPFIDQWQRVDLRTRAFNIPPCQVATMDGALLSVGADIQFRIWNPVMSVIAVQDLNASTRLTAQNAMTCTLGKKTAREVQLERVKLGERLGMDINDITRPWGLEVDRVELTVASVLQAPDVSQAGGVLVPPFIPGLEGLGPLQEIASHFLSSTGFSQSGGVVSLVDEQGCRRPDTPAPRTLEELLGAVEPLLSERLVRQVGACFQFSISRNDGQVRSCYVDLSHGAGALGLGTPNRDPDVTLQLSEEDLLALFEGSLPPFQAYANGRLLVHGDLSLALKLEELVKLLRP
ncbi:stomatin-like protein 1 [Brienomyrus brachyistius]|uniref:stomatin-like protein 1 n=1 Tax=Brienomyrus brachyistius TaxID=42636 RepID=UPI0020B25CCA|nr:stomatin-like protein 1 [Brienomyrus brachyistius]